MGSTKEIELGNDFLPKFNADGIIPVVTVDAADGQILMVAYMNEESLRLTVETRKATYYSRSRKKLWIKGEQSGFTQEVQEILVDCDQDCLILKVQVNGGSACHTGHKSCFYRRVDLNSPKTLTWAGEKVFDPSKVYGIDDIHSKK